MKEYKEDLLKLFKMISDNEKRKLISKHGECLLCGGWLFPKDWEVNVPGFKCHNCNSYGGGDFNILSSISNRFEFNHK